MCNATPLRSMNAAPAIASVPAKAPLPIQQIPGTTLANIENQNGKLAACGALVRYSTTQAYFIYQHVDKELEHKAVTVSLPNIEEPLKLQIDNVQDTLPSRSHLPMYVQVHHNAPERPLIEHLVDHLAETVMGRQNLELKKNITIDLFDSGSDTYMRDRAGFFVADRLQFRQITVDAAEASLALKKDAGTIVETLAQDELNDVIDYDNTLSAQTRLNFLEFIAQKCKIYVAKPRNADKSATDDEEEGKKALKLSGYAIVSDNANAEPRVLGLYAQTQAIADSLLAAYICDSNAKTVTFCSIRKHWSHLAQLSKSRERSIYRRHTRAVPSNVKWDRIFAVNVGMNLF